MRSPFVMQYDYHDGSEVGGDPELVIPVASAWSPQPCLIGITHMLHETQFAKT